MREFKFRIWDENKKEFISEDENVTIRANDGSVNAYPRYEDGFIIQQFTGLLDKNKKEIYEGDILGSHVSEKPCNYIVKWGETRSEYCGFVLNPVFINPPRFTYIIHNFKMWMAEGFEVLGNILENPELLVDK